MAPRLAEILQAVRRGAFHELMEVERLVLLFEVLVEEVIILRFPTSSFSSRSRPCPTPPRAGAARTRKSSSARDWAMRSPGSFHVADVVRHHLADRAAQVPARIGVVADIGNAVRRQVRWHTFKMCSRTGAGTQE